MTERDPKQVIEEKKHFFHIFALSCFADFFLLRNGKFTFLE